MKALALATVALALVSTPALAGDKGSERCSNRHLAGSWLTTFTYGPDLTRLACSFTLNRQGQIVASECMKDHVSSTGYTISGEVVADRLCQFSGEFVVPAEVEGDPATSLILRGEVAKDRDMMVGLIYPDVESFFEPLAIVRTADPRGKKLPKPQLPVDPDEDEEEIEFACAAELDGKRIEVEAEAFVGDATSTLHKFSAEFEAEPSTGLLAGDLIDFVVGDAIVGQAALEDDGDGEVEAEIGFNSRGAGFPATFPEDFGEGIIVKAMKGATELATCTVALDD